MNKLKAHMDNIALSHSVFALPFAYLGAILAFGGIPDWIILMWITLAMVGARSAALALNNYIDLEYDKRQPRFAKRPMVTGAIAPWEAIVFTLFCLALFLYAAAKLNAVCLTLAPLAIIPLAAYPYMKRFSWTCHLVLGLALSLAPIGAWIAVRAEISTPAIILGSAVGLWIAAFDVIYGCQDVEFDKNNRLHSIPVRFGIPDALLIARSMHTISVFLFVLSGFFMQLHTLYFIGVILAGCILIYQHAIVRVDDFSKVTQIYFMRNGLVSILILLFTLVSVFFHQTI